MTDGTQSRALAARLPCRRYTKVWPCNAAARVLRQVAGARDVAQGMEERQVEQSAHIHQVCKAARNASVPPRGPVCVSPYCSHDADGTDFSTIQRMGLSGSMDRRNIQTVSGGTSH